MDNCCENKATALQGRANSAAHRRVLWTVLWINLVLFAGEFAVGWWADSSALQADSLDGLGDALVYALSLAVAAQSLRRRAGAAVVKGALQAVFGVAVLVEVVRRSVLGAEPVAPVMMLAACVAFVLNLVCFRLLTRFRADDINMRSVWLCSRNDLVNNAGVLVAGALVGVTGSRWPDLVIGALVAVLFLQTAVQVLRDAWIQYSAPEPAPLPKRGCCG
ncbi:Cation efflux family protein [Pseudoxanthomonas sp. GM95]|uniref:cation transporter n=1 Tax=Pseudoxanthomonas sp. GM95 TaxID=1881043 RepID=UPI0008C1E818|nr:cation transporter [Pseudoxanthomonas sp. GM95]SEM25854.1 Cation efflux family protein [Pseudoxanthomonas sp. GM95]